MHPIQPLSLRRASRHWSTTLALTLALTTGGATAQDPFDPLDPTAAREDATRLHWSGDLLLRGDRVTGLPAGRADLERLRGRVRLGLDYWLNERVELGAGVRLSRGSDDNRDNRRNNDNERSNAIGLDRLSLRWRLGEHGRLSLGKDAYGLELSPLLWDEDLRPAGIGYEHGIPLGDFHRLLLRAGWHAGQHLYGDDSRIASGQIALHLREGDPQSLSLLLSLLEFRGLDTLVRQGLARTNRVSGGRLVSDYRLLDLQVRARTELAGRPLEAGLDVARNLGADDLRNAARFDLRLGDAGLARGWELGYALQRVQRDAVMAAFNDDDWWFASAARGYTLWLGYGVSSHWRLRLQGFVETRDGLDHSTRRLLLDIGAHW